MKSHPTRIPPETLTAARAAVASGLTVKEAAERLSVSYAALKKRASREKWLTVGRVRQEAARATVAANTAALEAVAGSLQDRGQRYVLKLAQAAERFADRAADLDADALMDRARAVETLDRVARRTFGLSDDLAATMTVIGIGSGMDYAPAPIDLPEPCNINRGELLAENPED